MIKNIFIGGYRKLFKKNNELAKKRLAICETCSHKIKLAGMDICDSCGCELSAKSRVESEICHEGKG